jgi:NAD(P)-dependent dehydrogenase (short-subunit alcohol dehydrogenase family)
MDASLNQVKSVLVTGATGALGRCVVEKFLKAGCQVTGTFHQPDRAVIENLKSVRWQQVDLSQSKEVKKAFSGQSFDALVHCAGGFRYATADQVSDEDLEFLLNANLK